MKAKDKKKKYIFFTLKNIIIFSIAVISIFYIIIFYHYYFGESVVYATEEVSSPINNLELSEAEKIDIDSYIQNNSKAGLKEEYTVEEVELEFLTKYKNNASLPKGTLQVTQEGRKGKQQITTKKTYENDQLISEEQVSAKITKAAVNKIVEVGTGSGRASNYEVKVGDTVYVTSDRLSVMVEPSEESQKVATLSQNDELKVLEIKGEWYRIRSGSTIGYVKSEATTYRNYVQEEAEKNSSNINTSTSQKSKAELLSTLSFGMALNKPSGLTLEQFKTILSDSKDKNKIFEQNAEYFYYIEKEYNINGVFVAAVGIHESNWGTSKIAQEKYNLFGYGAYDSNPYNGAYTFSDYSECIDLLARVFVKYYLNPAGTSIYGGETASGKYYNGPTLSGINQKYATDKNWANSVYTTMKYFRKFHLKCNKNFIKK